MLFLEVFFYCRVFVFACPTATGCIHFWRRVSLGGGFGNTALTRGDAEHPASITANVTNQPKTHTNLNQPTNQPLDKLTFVNLSPPFLPFPTPLLVADHLRSRLAVQGPPPKRANSVLPRKQEEKPGRGRHPTQRSSRLAEGPPGSGDHTAETGHQISIEVAVAAAAAAQDIPARTLPSLRAVAVEPDRAKRLPRRRNLE